jgi:hypothetical protein
MNGATGGLSVDFLFGDGRGKFDSMDVIASKAKQSSKRRAGLLRR